VAQPRRVPDYQYLVRHWRQTPEPVLERKLRAAALRYAAHHPTYVAEVVFWSTARMLDLAGMNLVAPHRLDDQHRSKVGRRQRRLLLARRANCDRRRAHLPRPTDACVCCRGPALLFLSVVLLAVETPRYRTGIDPSSSCSPAWRS
jgi:hypothetical protein